VVSLDLSVDVAGSQLVISLCGQLDAAGAPQAVAAVAGLGVLSRCVIFDLAALDFIDCFSLRALLELRRLAQWAGGDVLLAAPTEPVRRLLALTRMSARFCLYATVAAAVASAHSITAGRS
jgi:anti-anti-sigma factor